MLSTLLILLAVCLFLSWLTLMGIWWQKEHNNEKEFSFDQISYYGQYCARLARRGWYRCIFYLSRFGAWSNKKFARIFFSIFPNAEPAFTKKDTLTGLEHGPSSFFLKSISEKEGKRSRKK